jgi:hypothetical protein
VQGTQSLDRFGPLRAQYPTSCVVVCIALGVDLFGGGPCTPLYSLGGQGYMEILTGYEPGVLPEYFSGSFLLF